MAILIYRDCGIELIIFSHSNKPRPTTDQRCASIFPAAGQLDELELAPELQMQPMNQWHISAMKDQIKTNKPRACTRFPYDIYSETRSDSI